ncbi:MAG: tetratricopeptide repeat protein [Pseudomonadota bacterium]|jgi:tetratricopeptide (TPR) repeat protein
MQRLAATTTLASPTLGLSARSISALLSFFWRLRAICSPLDHDQQEKALRRLLRRFPFWGRGHRELAEVSLSNNLVALAYSSALCYEVLSQSSAINQAHAIALLGRCFLMRGDHQKALSYFSDARELGLNTPTLAEDTAAAHILKGDYAQAQSILSALDSDKISVAGRAALTFVATKTR